MPNNVPITAGSGTNIATEEVGAVHYQRVKLIDAVASSTLALNVVEDQASASGDPGFVLMARRTASPTNTSGLDGDYEALQLTGGQLWTLWRGAQDSAGVDMTDTVNHALQTTLVTMPQVIGAVAASGADAQAPVKVGMKAIDYGTTTTAVSTSDVTDWFADVTGIPFFIGGHPNVVTLEKSYTAATTNAVYATLSAVGGKLVVTQAQACCEGRGDVRLGFGTSTVPTSQGVVLSHPRISTGDWVTRGSGEGVVAVGAAGEALLITVGTPSVGSIRVVTTYYPIQS